MDISIYLALSYENDVLICMIVMDKLKTRPADEFLICKWWSE